MGAGFVSDLKNRRVVRAAIAYGVVAFGVLQIVEPVMHGLHWPDAVLTAAVLLLAAGFPVVIAVAWALDVSAGAAPRLSWKGALLVFGAACLLAAPGTLWFFLRQRTTPEAAAAAAAPSIAVLPLVNLSGEKDQEYFSDGLTEELLDLLAKVPGLRVAARTSAFAFKGRNEDIQAIAEKLHVATVLEGSVRKAGDRLRITTQLINAGDGFHLWSETYDRKLTDVFEVQDEIARAVVGTLRLKLLPPAAMDERRTGNPEAYNALLLGRDFMRRNDVDGFRRAEEQFEKAVALDPQYARAWAALALAHFWVADSADTPAAVAAGQKAALDAAGKAVALAPDLADGYMARGFLRGPLLFDWQGAKEDLRRALSLAPDDSEVLATCATVVRATEPRSDEVLRMIQRAAVLDPLNSRIWTNLGSTHLVRRELAEARKAYARSLEISPHQSFTPCLLGMTFLLDHDPQRFIEHCEQASNVIFRLTAEAIYRWAVHDLAASNLSLDALVAKYGHDAAYQIATVYAYRGEADEAFAWLERARAQRDGGLGQTQGDALLENLHADPRWPRFLAAVHLAR